MRFPRKGTFFSILKSEKSKKIVKKVYLYEENSQN